MQTVQKAQTMQAIQAMQTNHRAVFTTVQTEGALLPADLLARIARGDGTLDGLRPADYHLSGETINEATNRAWNRAVGAWSALKAARAQWAPGDPGTSDTRERWLLPLFQELGYGRLSVARAVELDGRSYPISHLWRNTPMHLVGAGVDLDQRMAGVAGAARTSPHSLVQELLGAAPSQYLWGFVSNGLRLRILRSTARLTRPAYVEFDLEAMMEGEAYSDFVLLWLLCHESRVEAERPDECWLERWAQTAEEQGTRALDALRRGVEQAIVALGHGFLAHPANGALRSRLREGALDPQDYYRQLLRLVYRLIFLFVAEDRDLLLAPQATRDARERYEQFYSTRRLRRLAGRRRGSRHSDLAYTLRLVMRGLGSDQGIPALGLPALGSFLFATGDASATPDLDGGEIANHDLLDAIRALAYTVEGGARRPVDYRNSGPEELGSVYESLLELHPVVDVSAGRFELATAAGNERKSSGSYYTPTGLIAALLDSALNPVLDEAARRPDPEQAILALKICDAAAGSGHFLLAAAQRVARRLAQVRTHDSEPTPPAYRTALRDVISHCIYGVDVNPMAVELCKVALWMEAVEPGKPLSFLDHHIKCGNALIGATRDLLKQGVPDDAFEAVTGDEKTVSRDLKKRNRQQREQDRHGVYQPEMLHTESAGDPSGRLGREYAHLDVLPQDTLAQIDELRARLDRLEAYYSGEKYIADAWTAAFFWPLDSSWMSDAPTYGELRKLEHDASSASIFLKQEVRRIAGEQRFFHWHLEFPNVFPDNASKGFDCVLGNPPWERIKLQEEEFFAQRSPEIAAAPTTAARKKLIAALPETDPALHGAYFQALRGAEAQSKFFRASGRFPLTARGDINLYSVFAETDRSLVSPHGRAGVILPTGIATDDTNKAFFSDVVNRRALVSLYDFENRHDIFPGVGHGRYKFSLLTVARDSYGPERADLVCFALRPEDLQDVNRHFTLSPTDFALINPNTRTLPIFRSKRDADLTRRLYTVAPVLVEEHDSEEVSPWGIRIVRMIDEWGDSQRGTSVLRSKGDLEACDYTLSKRGVFHRAGADDYLPVYESKLFHQFDHRFATYSNAQSGSEKPRGVTTAEHCDPDYTGFYRLWVPATFVTKFLGEWDSAWMLGLGDIARSTDERTMIAAAIPQAGSTYTVRLLLPSVVHRHRSLCLLANLNTTTFDYVVRQKIGGTHLNQFTLEQLPALPPETYDRTIDGERLAEWVTRRALELSYTSWSLQPLARDLGYDGPPFAWDEARRAQLRGELDGMYAHLYGLSRDDFAYILTTFPVLEKNERRKYGEYRTALLALAAYDELVGEMGVGG